MSQSSGSFRLSYYDTLLPDGAVERVYSNGVRERRVPQGPNVIGWSDSTGLQGRDIYLGRGQIRREDARGRVSEGQHTGHGVTVWNGGQYLTVNETPLPDPALPPPRKPGGLAGFLTGLGLGGLFGLSAAGVGPYGLPYDSPEYALYSEELARQEAARRAGQPGSSSGDGGSDGGDGGYYSDGDSGSFDDSGGGGSDWGGTDSFG